MIVVLFSTTMTLEAFGFTGTQARVYRALVSLGPSTGYAVARQAGLARANAYDALDALVARGLATATGGRPIRFTPASPTTTIGLVAGDFNQKLAELSSELGVVELDGRTSEDGSALVSELRGGGEVFDAVRVALEGAKTEALAVVGPWSEEVFGGFARCQERRVGLRVVSLGHPAPEAALVRTVAEADLQAYWGGLPLALVVDRVRAVCAVKRAGEWTGIATSHAALVPFVRHLLRRELASGAGTRA